MQDILTFFNQKWRFPASKIVYSVMEWQKTEIVLYFVVPYIIGNFTDSTGILHVANVKLHADNWSHPSHYLVDPYILPWSPNGHGHGHGHEWPTATPFVQCRSALPFWDTAISKFDHENPWLRSCVWSKVKVMFDLQNSKVKVMVKVKPIGESICLLFVSWQSEHFWLRYRKFYIWPWKFKVKVMAKVKPDGHIWALEFNRYVWFFISWQSDHFWLRYSKFHIWPWKI